MPGRARSIVVQQIARAFFGALGEAAGEVGVVRVHVLVGRRSNHDGHWHRVAQNQRLLAAVGGTQDGFYDIGLPPLPLAGRIPYAVNPLYT